MFLSGPEKEKLQTNKSLIGCICEEFPGQMLINLQMFHKVLRRSQSNALIFWDGYVTLVEAGFSQSALRNTNMTFQNPS